MPDNLNLRVMPHNDEAEKCVLGCVLIDNDSVGVLRESLNAEDFYSEQNRCVFRAMMALNERGMAVDPLTLSNELKQREEFDKIGGYSLLTEIGDSVVSTRNVENYCTIIKDKAIRRKIIRDFGTIIDASYSSQDDTDAMIDQAQKAVYDISMYNNSREFTKLSDAVKDAITRINEIQKMGGNVLGVPSGFSNLDDITAGFQPGDFCLIAGRPSMGKTALGVNIAQNAAIRYDKKIAFFSLEMPIAQLSNRIISSEAEIDSSKLRVAKVHHSEWSKLYDAVSSISKKDVKLFMDETSGISIGELRRKCRKLKASEGLDMIVIDYIQLITTSQRYESRQQEVSDISRQLKGLAKELEIPVLALSQLSRGAESRQGHRPMLSDLRESGAIEQDADLVMLLYREQYYNQESTDTSTEVIIAKHRNGSTGTIKLQFEKEYTKFVEIEETDFDSEAYDEDNLI